MRVNISQTRPPELAALSGTTTTVSQGKNNILYLKTKTLAEKAVV